METPFGDNGEDDSSYNKDYDDFDDEDECTCDEVPCCDMDCICMRCH